MINKIIDAGIHCIIIDNQPISIKYADTFFQWVNTNIIDHRVET